MMPSSSSSQSAGSLPSRFLVGWRKADKCEAQAYACPLSVIGYPALCTFTEILCPLQLHSEARPLYFHGEAAPL